MKLSNIRTDCEKKLKTVCRVHYRYLFIMIFLAGIFASVSSEAQAFFSKSMGISSHSAWLRMIRVNYVAPSGSTGTPYLSTVYKGRHSNTRNNSFEEIGEKLLSSRHLQAPAAIEIRGRVTDESNSPLEGVTVQVKGLTTGTSTDARGNYVIEVPDKSSVLLFSFVGFAPKEVTVGEQSRIDVALSRLSTGLDEVVVVGYGSQRKKDVTGSISTVDAKQLQDIPIPSFSEALTGRMAGVSVQQTTGAPGGGISIKIRGVGSISAGNEPLYVIDGMPIDNTLGSATAQGKSESSPQPVDPLSSININDIESIDVLKDAAATAIYGSRGTNGVVIITTKKGSAGKTQLKLNASNGWQVITHKLPTLTLDKYLKTQTDVINMSWERQGGNANDPNSMRPRNLWIPNEYKDPSLNNYTNWQDLIYRTAGLQNYQMSASGGTKSVKYYLSGNYVDQQGIIVNSDYKRFGLRANVDANVSDRVQLGFRITPTYSTSNVSSAEGISYTGGIVNPAIGLPPIAPAVTDDGLYSYHYTLNYDDGSSRTSSYINPLATAMEVYQRFDQFRTLGTIFATVDILDNLQFKTSINGDINVFNSNQFWPSTVSFKNSIPPIDPHAVTFNSRNISWVNENILTYDNTFREKHRFEGLLGLSEQKSTFLASNLEAFNFPNDRVRTINAAGSLKKGMSEMSEWSMVSLFARVLYNFEEKYLFMATFRRDGSSRFGHDNKWGNFPSASIGWRISKEKFLANNPTVSDLKVRFSYGLTGNNQIPNYGSLGLLASANYILGTGDGIVVNGLAQNTISNPDLGWEKAKEFNIGLDAGLIHDRIYFSLDYYNKITSNLLLNVPVPFSTGFSTALSNIGSMRNRGFEIAIQSTNIRNSKFTWQTNLNFSSNKNEVLALGQDNAPLFGANTNVDNSISNITKVGEPLGSFYGYVVEGIYNNQNDLDHFPRFSSSQLGDLRFKDLNGDGELTIDDKTIIGNNYPDYTFGIVNSFSYGNFDFRFLVQGVQGMQVLNENKRSVSYTRNLEYYQNYWRSPQQPGDGNTPSLIASGNSRNISSWMVEDASYVRIKNATLGYRLPQKIIQDARIYLNVQNLYTFTKFQGYNPEVSTMTGNLPTSALIPGIAYGTYPLARTFTIGVNLTF